MPIDLSTESPFTLTRATRHRLLRAKSRNGRAINFSTVWRWATCGVRGVKLETCRIGTTLCTTSSAIERFIEKLSEPQPDNGQTVRTLSRRQHDQEMAERQLAAAGI